MKLSLNWIKQYVDVKISVDQLSHKLTMAGLEVEKIEKVDGDTVFEIEVTPNRPDCLNMIGLAREVSAVLNKSLKLPKSKKIKYPSQKAEIAIENKKDCSRYIGTVINGVNIQRAPKGMLNNLASMGNRGINNIVDITNFCLLETGQPLHAFDYDKLVGGKIIVRRAKKGETLTTLDGIERKLDPAVLVIADAKKPVALAGIIGGANTEVTSKTKNILLESAYFDPILTRRAARKLGISTDASYRFERGVDIGMVLGGAQRAIDLISQNAGGIIVKHKDLFLSKSKTQKPSINISMEYIKNFLGGAVPLSRCKTILSKLDFKVAAVKGNALKVSPPAFREDVLQKEDVVEEIARIIGYDNLPSSMPIVQIDNIPENKGRIQKNRLRDVLVAQGFDELITYTMVEQSVLDRTRLGDLKGVKIKNPLTQDQEMMNPAMLTRFLSVVLSNLNKGQKDFRFFEVGKTYAAKGEKEKVAILMTGLGLVDWRETKKRQVGFYDIKGVAQELLSKKSADFVDEDMPIFEKGQSVAIKKGTKAIGFLGKVNAAVLNDWDIKQKDIFFAQMDLAELYKILAQKKKFSSIPGYPPIVRDISVALKKDISFQVVKDIVKKNGSELLCSITFVEEYLGEQLPKDCRGITFSLTYRSPSRTLRDEEVSVIHENIRKALIEKTGAVSR